MSTFADSSALVKLYADEPGAAVVRAAPEPLLISVLARAEVTAALWRKHRAGELSRTAAATLTARFAADFSGTLSRLPRFAAIAATIPLLETAAKLAETYGLRAYDATQLASATAARAADPQCETFACFDSALCSAAQAEGFSTELSPPDETA